MATVYLGLGSNMGEREQSLALAVKELNDSGIKIVRLSRVYETDPIGGPQQEKFLNTVVKAKCELSPLDLLQATQTIEQKLGRVRTVKNGPRTIDIDILLYDQLKMQLPQLTIPHPRMMERDFVLTPLKEIEPNYEKIIPR